MANFYIKNLYSFTCNVLKENLNYLTYDGGMIKKIVLQIERWNN